MPLSSASFFSTISTGGCGGSLGGIGGGSPLSAGGASVPEPGAQMELSGRGTAAETKAPDGFVADPRALRKLADKWTALSEDLRALEKLAAPDLGLKMSASFMVCGFPVEDAQE